MGILIHFQDPKGNKWHIQIRMAQEEFNKKNSVNLWAELENTQG